MGLIWGSIGGHLGAALSLRPSALSAAGVVAVAKQENNPTSIGLTQYLDPSYWTWAAEDPNGAALLQQGAEAILAYVVQRLEATGCEVVEAYGIVHDKDEREVWSDTERALVIEPKPDHLHAVIKFASRAKSAPLDRLAFGIGVEPQYVEKPGRGRYAYDNMLSYLTHVKYADKHQYAPSEVATVRGPDYLGIDAQRRETWLKGRAHVKKKVVAENFEDMRERVLQGEFTRDQIMLTDELFDIYSRHQREIDDALSAYDQRRAYRAAAKLRAGEFSTHVVFVHGDAGIGKTRFATDFITEAINAANAHGERWQVYRAATGNPLDDWRGEEVLLLDDLRASAMDANDWLLLLDPYNASPAKARYKNKGEVAPRLIVITATIEPVEFFYYARQKGNVDEALDQFIRRLASVVKVYRADDINRYLVQHIGKIEPYEWHQCSIPTAAHTPGMYGKAYHQNAASRSLVAEAQKNRAATASAIEGLKAQVTANQKLVSQVGGAVQRIEKRTEERVEKAVEQVAGEASATMTASLDASNARAERIIAATAKLEARQLWSAATAMCLVLLPVAVVIAGLWMGIAGLIMGVQWALDVDGSVWLGIGWWLVVGAGLAGACYGLFVSVRWVAGLVETWKGRRMPKWPRWRKR